MHLSRLFHWFLKKDKQYLHSISTISSNYFYLFCALFFLPATLFATDSTKSEIQFENFSTEGIFVNDQVTSIVTDNRGLVYFSLSTGIAEFDGNEWRLIPLTVKTDHQQLAVNSKGRIFLGSEKSLGQLVVENSGRTLFNEIYQLPDSLGISYLAKTLVKDSLVYFIADNAISIYNQENLSLYRFKGTIITAEFFDNRLFVMEQQKGLGYLDRNYHFVPVEKGHMYRSHLLKVYQSSLLIPTYSHGLFKLEKSGTGYTIVPFEKLSEYKYDDNNMVSLDVFEDKFIAFTTNSHFFLYSEDKGIIGTKAFDKNELKNPVYYLYFSPRGSIWLGRQNSVTLVNSRRYIWGDSVNDSLQSMMRLDSLNANKNSDSLGVGFFYDLFKQIDNWLYNTLDFSFTNRDYSATQVSKSDFVSIVRKVELTANDSTVFAGAFTKEQLGVQSLQQADTVIYQFTNEQNAFRFTFTSNSYEEIDQLRYQTKLTGLDFDWSIPTTNIFREYTNLDWGKYSFNVRAIDAKGNISSEASYRFRINPPWHQTIWFFFVQIGFIIGMLIISHQLSKRGYALTLADKLVAISVLITFEYINMYLEGYIEVLAGGVAFFEVGIIVVTGLVLDPVVEWYKSMIEHFSGTKPKTEIE